MTDYFALLGQPRRPWIDPETLREDFQRAAAEQHPDAPGGGEERFSALNAAHGVLREPASRLRHLLELTAAEPSARAVSVPTDLADLFMQIAGQRRAWEQFRGKLASASSPLARALLAGEKAALQRGLEAAQQRLTEAHAAALAALQALDAAWETRDAATLEALADLQARLAFLGKWAGQLREDLFQLST